MFSISEAADAPARRRLVMTKTRASAAPGASS